jgi:hypothetical protein
MSFDDDFEWLVKQAVDKGIEYREFCKQAMYKYLDVYDDKKKTTLQQYDLLFK